MYFFFESIDDLGWLISDPWLYLSSVCTYSRKEFWALDITCLRCGTMLNVTSGWDLRVAMLLSLRDSWRVEAGSMD
jgi:hypothetical protein